MHPPASAIPKPSQNIITQNHISQKSTKIDTSQQPRRGIYPSKAIQLFQENVYILRGFDDRNIFLEHTSSTYNEDRKRSIFFVRFLKYHLAPVIKED